MGTHNILRDRSMELLCSYTLDDEARKALLAELVVEESFPKRGEFYVSERSKNLAILKDDEGTVVVTDSLIKECYCVGIDRRKDRREGKTFWGPHAAFDSRIAFQGKSNKEELINELSGLLLSAGMKYMDRGFKDQFKELVAIGDGITVRSVDVSPTLVGAYHNRVVAGPAGERIGLESGYYKTEDYDSIEEYLNSL